VALQRKWAIVFFAVIIATMVGFVLQQVPSRYAASASVMVDTRQPHVSNGESLLSSQVVDGDLLRTRMEALHAPRLLRDVVVQLGLTSVAEYCAAPVSLIERLRDKAMQIVAPASGSLPPSPPCHTSIEDAAKQLEPNIAFSNDGRSYVIRITATAGDPRLAAKIANAYADRFIAGEHAERAGLTAQANQWLSNHLAELRAAVVAADAAVEQQRRGGQLTNLRGTTLLGQTLSDLNAQLTAATAELAQKRSTLNALDALARAGNGSADAGAPALASPLIQQLIGRAAALEVAQADLTTRLGAANPEVIANAAQLDRIRQQIRIETGKTVTSVRNEVEALEARRAALVSDVAKLQNQLGEQGNAEMRLQDLQRDAISARSQYDAAAARLEEIRVEAATQRADVQPLVEAIPPEFPSYPRKHMIIAGTFMASLGLGAGLAFALEMLSRVFKEPEQIEEETGLRVLGLFAKPLRRRTKPQDFIVQNPTSLEADALQAVLGNIIGNRARHAASAGRVVMVTSSVPGEGKTTFAVALGRAGASRGLSVAVVDCDLRRSMMSDLFSTSPMRDGPTPKSGQGFVDLQVDQKSGMHLLLAGECPRNPHALLASSDLAQAVGKLRADHDLVIIDTPPVLAVPDALTLAGLADDVVMLVQLRRTAKSSVHAALKALRRAKVDVYGIVLSKVDLRRLGRSVNDNYYAKLYPAYHVARRG
jgi:capsular exopolysaccharide synthesis family protein